MRRARNGGIPARRAVFRWALRLFRREWRQQALVMALLAVAVTTAVIGLSAGYQTNTLLEGRFGDAQQLVKYYEGDSKGFNARIAAEREWFGTVDVIGHSYKPIPGSVQTVELRRQDPHGPFSRPMLRLLSGRYPTTTGEVAVTDDVATTLTLHVGGQLNLFGTTYHVVGLVENPSDLNSEFVLVSLAQPEAPQSITVLTAANPARFNDFLQASGGVPLSESRSSNARTMTAVGVFSFLAVGMLLIALIAAAGFAVLAQRRLRQLGLLAAIGATQRHLRFVLLTGAAVVGVVAAAAGAAGGTALWFVFAPRLEAAVGHRIDRLDLPWWQLAGAVGLAIVTAMAAAWRPARVAARVHVTQALSARPPRPKPANRSAIVAVLLVMGGVACLRFGQRIHPAFIVAGTLAIGLGMMFVSPLAIGALAIAGRGLPVAGRLALRDLARYRARSGAALAAIGLALAIPVAVVITTTAQAHAPVEGNLSSRQLLIRIGPPDNPLPAYSQAQQDGIGTQVRRYLATLDDPAVIPLFLAVDPREIPQPSPDGGPIGRLPIGLGVQTGPGSFYGEGGPAFVATPELLRQYGVDPTSVRPDTDVLTTKPGEPLRFILATKREAAPLAVKEPLHDPGYTSLPRLLLTPASLQRHGWTPAPAGWLVETAKPLTAEQRSAALDMAVDAGATVEYRNPQSSLLTTRITATVSGAIVALGVLAITIGLIRAEAAGDLRTLAATGANRRIRRTITATTAGSLALLGAILGISMAYAGIAASLGDDVGQLRHVPVVELLVTMVVVPVVAAVSGWLLAGREPRSLARVRLE